MLKTEHLQQRTPRELRRLFWIRLGLGCFHRARATVDGGEGATKAPQSEGVLLAISMNDNAAEVSPLDSFEREATRLCDVKKERVGTMDLEKLVFGVIPPVPSPDTKQLNINNNLQPWVILSGILG